VRGGYRVLAYGVLCLVCLTSAGILFLSDRYGLLAAGFQLALAVMWALMAYASWRFPNR
jgi:hypothetical protein